MDDDSVPDLVCDSAASSIRINESIEQSAQHINNSSIQLHHTTNQITENTEQQSNRQVPISILSGYLGSGVYFMIVSYSTLHVCILNQYKYIIVLYNIQTGKTTLLRQVIKHFGDVSEKLLVIQNEFSDIGVELELVDAATTPYASLVEYSNGCICCTIKSDFVSGLEALISDKQSGKLIYDYIIIECSGLVDVGKLIEMYWLDSNLDACVYLDSVICVVDAYNYNNVKISPDDVLCINKQIAYADTILLNKCDLIDDTVIQQLIHIIQQINNIAPIQQTVNSITDVSNLLHQHRFDLSAVTNQFESNGTIDHEHNDTCHCQTDSHLHNNDITSHVFKCNDPNLFIDLTRFNHWLADLLWRDTSSQPLSTPADHQVNTIYRMKAILNVQHHNNTKYYMQAVQQLYDIQASDNKWSDGNSRHSSLVVIGKNLDIELLHEQFMQCMTKL